ncbi:GAD-like domain-containing protein [Pseudomonas sp. KU43P]|uniref:GAD-like domain-containing protein n=1 Tax=Pseudomonas sp. KU43P TaxID=2487887 RepID=UPI0012A93974|nr:GAD-like domain-containing protein [Pseudomonas sp. KU43P]BBH45045.1 aspartyl-tRNA amidotransferase subunit B [Pseudomonas sp. KU43P]
MDEAFSIFLEEFGSPIESREVPPSSIQRYQGILPNQLLTYWREHGWCGYGEGIFWMVNPQDYDGVVESWLESTKFANSDKYHVIARSAFGDLYLWGETSGASLKITSILSRYSVHQSIYTGDRMDAGVRAFMVSKRVDTNDYGDLFKPAKKKLAPLHPDEMYGFTPAIMLGGADKLENLEKVKIVEHLIFLSQLTTLNPFDLPEL